MNTFEMFVLAGMVIIMVEILLLIWIVGAGIDEFLALLIEKEKEKEEEYWVLGRDQQRRRVRKPPTYSRPSDLSDPQMGEGRHG